MLRLSRLLRAASSHYEVLGVPPTASKADIQIAFRERAKLTHPDVSNASNRAAATERFREMVEAYRVLRHPERRAAYDLELQQRQGVPGASAPWSRAGGGGGPGFGRGSSEFRANLYNYPIRDEHPSAPAGDAQFMPAGAWAERAAIGVVAVSGLSMVLFGLPGRPDPSTLRDPDPYPSRQPMSAPSFKQLDPHAPPRKAGSEEAPTIIGDAGIGEVAMRAASREASASDAPPQGAALSATGSAGGAIRDGVVRAYFNPFANKWHRIPEGYDPPGAMDLTAWHHKRTDPTEWSRLFAEGRLSKIIPRGGLKVRYRPMWDTHEPILVMDPETGRTVEATGRLPSRSKEQQKCEVQF